MEFLLAIAIILLAGGIVVFLFFSKYFWWGVVALLIGIFLCVYVYLETQVPSKTTSSLTDYFEKNG